MSCHCLSCLLLLRFMFQSLYFFPSYSMYTAYLVSHNFQVFIVLFFCHGYELVTYLQCKKQTKPGFVALIQTRVKTKQILIQVRACSDKAHLFWHSFTAINIILILYCKHTDFCVECSILNSSPS